MIESSKEETFVLQFNYLSIPCNFHLELARAVSFLRYVWWWVGTFQRDENSYYLFSMRHNLTNFATYGERTIRVKEFSVVAKQSTLFSWW